MNVVPLISLIVALGTATSAWAQSETPQKFVSNAAQSGMTEVELGSLALSKAQNREVKKFAERMVKDHGKANTQLDALAKSKSLAVPKKLDAEHQSMVDMLKGKSGAEFDSTYMHHMTTAHSKSVALFERASRLSDVELAGFAKKTLPTLKEHKLLADSLNSSIGKLAVSSSRF